VLDSIAFDTAVAVVCIALTATDRALADYDAKNLEQANTIRAL